MRHGPARGRGSLLRRSPGRRRTARCPSSSSSRRERPASIRVPPTVFRPKPRVESALVAFERETTAPIADVRPVVEGAFAHRRKTARQRARPGGRRDTRDQRRGGARGARAASERAGRGARRPRSSSRWRRRCGEARRARTRRSTSRSSSARCATTASTRSSTVLQRIDLHDTIALEAAETLVVEGFAEDTIVRDGARGTRESGGLRAALARRASRSGSRSLPASEAGAATRRRRSRSRTSRSTSRSLAMTSPASRRASARTCRSSSSAERSSGRATGRCSSALELADRLLGRPRRPDRSERRTSTGDVYARIRRPRRCRRVRAARAAALADALASVTTPHDLGRTSAQRPRLVAARVASSRLPGRSARTSSGAGPAVYGLFEEHATAMRAAEALSDAGRTFVARPIEAGDRS